MIVRPSVRISSTARCRGRVWWLMLTLATLPGHALLAETLDAQQPGRQGGTSTWGVRRSVAPLIDYREGAGLILGARAARVRYGFHRVPIASRMHVDALFGLDALAFGVEIGVSHAPEASPWRILLDAHASRFDAFRFYGLGNDTRAGDHDLALVRQDRAWVQPGLALDVSRTARLAFGLRADWAGPDAAAGSPLVTSGLAGREPHALASAWAQVVLSSVQGDAVPVGGVHLAAGASATPAVLDAAAAFGDLHAEVRSYFTFGPTLALRAGGHRVWGAFPAQRAAFIGGRTTVRGFRHQRFAGDAALSGSAELRVPIRPLTRLARGEVGLIGFTDAGRVYVQGESPAGWHTGAGAGLWYSSRSLTVNGTWARGEEDRVYFSLGMPF